MAKGKQMLYTQQGYQELIDELHYLKHEKREKIKNDIAVARSFGDLSENSEYDEARNEQAKNEARIKELEELVENAVILDESSIDTSVVSLGSTVKVLNLAYLTRKSKLSNGDQVIGNDAVGQRGDQRKRDTKVGGRLVQMHSADDVQIYVVGRELQTEPFFEHS